MPPAEMKKQMIHTPANAPTYGSPRASSEAIPIMNSSEQTPGSTRIVPITSTKNTLGSGLPSAAIHSAQSVGHNSSQMPIGRCSRIKRA